MKKALLSILFLGMACTTMAREPSETELLLSEKVKWCQAEGQKLYEQAQNKENPPHVSKMCFDGAMKFFTLEHEYMNDLGWHQLIGDIIVSLDCDCDCDDCDCDDEYDAQIKIGNILKNLKS